MGKAPELRIYLKQQQLFFEHRHHGIPSRKVLPLYAPQNQSQPRRGTGWDLLQLHTSDLPSPCLLKTVLAAAPPTQARGKGPVKEDPAYKGGGN